MDASTSYPNQPKNQRIDNDRPALDIYCWGNHGAGQLGVGGIEEEQIFVPRTLKSMHNKHVADIACGVMHTLFVLKDGTVYSCGSNDSGQLGHDKGRKRPEQIDSLETQVIRQVACGAAHNVALNENGEVFTWGDNTEGQLGRGFLDDTYARKPKLVRSLMPFTILQVACGENHVLALTSAGQIFSWGSNSHGQLGLGVCGGYRDSPQHVECLTGITPRFLSAGGSHSLMLTVSGALFGWGKNSFGQLGIGDEKDRHFPTLCRTLRSQRVKFVTCGKDHTAVLTQDGGVFTFGAGMYGQLGHNSTSNEYLPKKVFELMGSTVTQLQCGRHHTVAYVSNSTKLYSFGLGGNGQLGVGSTNKYLNPISIKAKFVSDQNSVVKQVFSGGDQCFVTVCANKAGEESADFRETGYKILTLDADRIKNYSLALQGNEKDETVSKDDKHYACSKRWHGVDLNAAEEGFQKIVELPNQDITQLALSAIEKKLLPNLKESPPDLEALRLYLTLPMCFCFQEPKHYDTIICPFARAILQLEKVPSKVLDIWWSKLKPSLFKKQVNIYKQVVIHILFEPAPENDFQVLVRQRGLHLCMDVMKKLNEVNDQNGQIIRYDHFYLPELHEKVDIRADYINWISQRRGTSMLSFCNYPFVFDAQAKTLLLQTDALLQMQVAVDEAQRRNFTSLLLAGNMMDPVNPMLVLYVSRNNIVSDVIAQIGKQGNCDFKKPLKVMFMGEEALDAGGVRKEFFMLLLREILDPKYGMFKYFEESRLIWFNSQSFEDNRMYSLIGIVCGLAIYNANIIDINFPLALYKKLLNKPITLDDLKQLEPAVGKSMQDLLDYEHSDVEDVFCLTYQITYTSVWGDAMPVDLKPDGSNIPVTAENRQEFVDLYIDYMFNKSVEDQFSAFNDGFHKVCGGRVLELFHPQELQAMVIGNEEYDWDQLEKNTEYKGEFHANHKTIKFFWEVFRELSFTNKKKFLMFLTGSDRIPIHGMKALKMFIQPTGGGDDFLPVAHTCFNLLDLPKYQSKQALQDKLCMAIQHTEGFGIV